MQAKANRAWVGFSFPCRTTAGGLRRETHLVGTVDFGSRVDKDLKDSQVAKPSGQEQRIHPELGSQRKTEGKSSGFWKKRQ